VKDKIRSNIAASNFIALSVDDATSCDNTSWLSMHVYTCEDWVRVLYLLTLSKIVEHPIANHLTQVVMSAVEKDGGGDGGGVGGGGGGWVQVIWRGSCSASEQMERPLFRAQDLELQRRSRETILPTASVCTAWHTNATLHSRRCQEWISLRASKRCFKRLILSSLIARLPRRLEEFFRLADVIETKGLRMFQNVENLRRGGFP
jgi:hypothetical protein